jgi:hypothetical protein
MANLMTKKKKPMLGLSFSSKVEVVFVNNAYITAFKSIKDFA